MQGRPVRMQLVQTLVQPTSSIYEHLVQLHHWHCTQVLDTPPGAKQEAVLGQALSSLRGLQDAAQPGAPAVQLLPPEPQVLAHALLSNYNPMLKLKPLEGFAKPCPREVPVAARQL